MNFGNTIFFFSFLILNFSACFAQEKQDSLGLLANKELK